MTNNEWKILGEWRKDAGDIVEHYFLQDIYVANKIMKSGETHVYDVGSRIDGYISHLLSMGIEVTMLDVRPMDVDVSGLHFIQADAMVLDNIPTKSIKTFSSLHAIEHFGLGRYNDPIDYHGWEKGIKAMCDKVQIGGYFYLSVPIGNHEKVCFNAHRIFNPKTIIDVAENCDMKIITLAVVHNNKLEEYDFTMSKTNISSIISTLGEYDCGIFTFKKY